MKVLPKVSVITVCRNSVATVERTIKSVLSQDYPNIEYIIIDGNSTDGTCDIIKHYKTHLTSFISEDDRGIYDAFNKGLKLANGDFIQYLNADDYINTDQISTCVKYFRSNGDWDILYGDIILVDERGNEYTRNQPHLISLGNACNSIIINHPTFFVKREVYQKVKFRTYYKIAGDYDWTLQALNAGFKFRYQKDNIIYMSNSGISNNNRFFALIETYKIIQRNAACGWRSKLKNGARVLLALFFHIIMKLVPGFNYEKFKHKIRKKLLI